MWEGTTLVVPQKAHKERGFSPCGGYKHRGKRVRSERNQVVVTGDMSVSLKNLADQTQSGNTECTVQNDGGNVMHHRSRQLTISLAVLLLALAAGAPAVFAQSAPSFASDLYLDSQVTTNTCSAGEAVTLSGNVHVQYSVSVDSTTGKNLFAITASNNLTGVGQSTGTVYLAGDSSDYNVSSSQSSTEATVEFKTDLVSQGAAPSMTLVQTLHLLLDTGGNITIDIPQNATQCGS